ncbi:hypothetical protein [Bdellovibrio sp. BCCA]|uniref:hypothetical protein n=1 Tax=Bdellovibrio sp. BCCA TaxID=3136281 RepID=UPI0030EFF2D4
MIDCLRMITRVGFVLLLLSLIVIYSKEISLIYTENHRQNLLLSEAEKVAEETFGVKTSISEGQMILYQIESTPCVKIGGGECPKKKKILLRVAVDSSKENILNLSEQIRASKAEILSELSRNKNNTESPLSR